MKEVADMLKAIHAQEDKATAKEKATLVVTKPREMKLEKAASKFENGIHETITCMIFLVHTGRNYGATM